MAPLTDHASLGEPAREALETAVARLQTLEEVIRWGLILPEKSIILEVIIQDEYTHDVVMKWRGDHHIVFDTT